MLVKLPDFFRFSPKRQRYLERAIDLVCPDATAKKLKDACRTRWIERIDSYAVFLELFPAVHACLQAMIVPTHHFHTAAGGNWNWDGETLTKANGFLYQLQSSSFLLCFKILLEFFTVLRCLSTKLQMRASSVLCAYSQVCDVIADITTLRDNSDQEFKRILTRPQNWANTSMGRTLNCQSQGSTADKCIEATLKRLVLKSTTGLLCIMNLCPTHCLN